MKKEKYLFSVRKWHHKASGGVKTASASDKWIFEVGQHFDAKENVENSLGMIESSSTVKRSKKENVLDDFHLAHFFS